MFAEGWSLTEAWPGFVSTQPGFDAACMLCCMLCAQYSSTCTATQATANWAGNAAYEKGPSIFMSTLRCAKTPWIPQTHWTLWSNHSVGGRVWMRVCLGSDRGWHSQMLCYETSKRGGIDANKGFKQPDTRKTSKKMHQARRCALKTISLIKSVYKT